MPAPTPITAAATNANVNQRDPSRRFRAIYIAALSTIAGLAIAAQIMMIVLIGRLGSDATLINVASRQRMLSQRLGSQAQQLDRALREMKPAEVKELEECVRATLDQWTHSHHNLVARAGAGGLTGRNTSEVASALKDLGEDQRAAAEQAAALLTLCVGRGEGAGEAAGGQGSTADGGVARAAGDERRTIVAALLNATERFVPKMNATVGRYERESLGHIDLLQGVGITIIFLTPLVVAAQAAFVFEPAVRRLRRQHQVIHDSTQQLQLLSRIAENTINAVIITDAQSRIVWVNSGFTRISGYSLEEVVGKVPGHLLQCENSQPEAIAALRNAVRHGGGCRTHIVNRSKAGVDYVLDIELQPLHDEAGTLTGFMALECDVTERVAAEEYITRQEALLREMGDAAGVGGWALKLGTGELHWTQQTKQIHEVEDSYVPDLKRALDFYPPAGREDLANAVELAVATGKSFDLELPFVTAKGRSLWVRSVGRAEQHDGKTVRLYGAFQDMTLQVEHRRAMRAQAERLDLTVRSANLGTWDWDITQGRVVRNDVAHTMLGYAPGDYDAGKPRWEEILHPDDRAAIDHALKLHLSGETEDYRAEYRVRRADGNWAWILSVGRSTQRDHAGRATRAMGVNIDITQAQEAAEALKHARVEADAANAAKSEFLANMSHEIRTPMTAILGYSELLAEDNGITQAPVNRLNCIGTIRRNGEHLLNIINDILDLSKIEAGKMTVERLRVDPRRMLAEVETLMRVKAQAKGIALAIKQETALPETIESDPVRLRQVLVNLVGNAVKFTQQGSVTISARLDADTNGAGLLRVSVHDTGIGMTPQQMGRLFGSFQQADSSSTRKFGGTGLGLRISQTLSRLLGGDVTVVSALGVGSTFTATIATGDLVNIPLLDVGSPQLEPSLTPQQITADDPRPLDGIRVLLAEDGLDNQRLIAFHLRKAGATLHVRDNGKLALEALTRDGTVDGPLMLPAAYDLVITDIQMPEMDGYTLASTLRAKGWPHAIIALTAHAMSGDAERCLNAGCDAYASKPIEKAKLLHLCKVTVARRLHAA